MTKRARDIRLLDSYLIAGGAGLIAFSLFGLTWFDATRGFVLHGIVLGLLSMIVGGRVRASETKAIDLWKLLDAAREISVTDVHLTTGWPRRRILRNLALVNTAPGVEYVHLADEDMIVDRRLLETIAVHEECGGCGYEITEEVPLLLREAPRCPSCGAGMTTDLNERKADLLERMKHETASYQDPSQFRGCLFLLLWIFPPAAIGYAAYSAKKHLDRAG